MSVLSLKAHEANQSEVEQYELWEKTFDVPEPAVGSFIWYRGHPRNSHYSESKRTVWEMFASKKINLDGTKTDIWLYQPLNSNEYAISHTWNSETKQWDKVKKFFD